MMDMKKIKARLSRITPGEWTYCGQRWKGEQICQCGGIWGSACFVAKCAKFTPSTVEEMPPGPNQETFEANVRFIAAAPTDIAALIAEVEKLTAEVDSFAVENANLVIANEKLRKVAEAAGEFTTSTYNCTPSENVCAKFDALDAALEELEAE